MGNDTDERDARLADEIGIDTLRRDYEKRFFEFDQLTAKTTEAEMDSDFYFDDCPVCRAMRSAGEDGRELSLPELQAAFAEAEKAGGSTGWAVSADPDGLTGRAGEA